MQYPHELAHQFQTVSDDEEFVRSVSNIDIEEREFDVAFCRPLIEETACALLKAKLVSCSGKIHELTPAQIASAENKKVILFGSYWKEESVAALANAASSVTSVVFSEGEISKYSSWVQMCTTDKGILSPRIHSRYPWLHYILTKNRLGVSKEHEAFYRGFLHYGKTRFRTEVKDILEAAFNGEFVISITACMEAGNVILEHNEQESMDMVIRYSVTLFRGSTSLRFIIGGAQPVMPLVMEAARHADIGVNVRFYAQENVTRFTFYTWSPEQVDLSFVKKILPESGGEAHCKGGNRPGFFTDTGALIEFLQSEQ